MKITQAYISGWKALLQNKKMWLALYGVQVFLALLAALPFSGYLGSTVGQSLDLTNSLGRFDYTFINDFLLTYGGGFKAILNQSFGFILLYLLLMAFLMGGILTVIKSWKKTDSFADFFLGAGHFFWRILRMSFYFLIPQLLLMGIMGGIFLKMTNYLSPFELESETVIINAAYLLLPIYLFLATILFMIHDLAKLSLVHRDENWLTSTIRDSYKIAFSNFRKYFPLYLLNIFFLLLLSGIYVFINQLFSPSSLAQIIVFLLLGQFYLFLRMGLKVVNLASLNELYSNSNSNIEAF